MSLRHAAIFLCLAHTGCSVIVSSTLDGKNGGDADVDTDADTDTDACSLEGDLPGLQSEHDVNFAGGGELGAQVIATGEDIAGAGADLAVIAKWNGSGSSFGYETQLFDEVWANVTGHNRVQDVAQDPMTVGSMLSSDNTIFAVFPQAAGAGSSLIQVPLTFDAVGRTLDEGARVQLLSHGVPIRGPYAIRADNHAFYFYAEASAVEGGDSSAFVAMAPIGEAAGAPMQLNPGSGHHAAVSGAYSESTDRVVFVYERTTAGAGDVLYGLLDGIPSVVQAASPGISPPGGQSGLPAIAAADDVALVTYTSRPDETGSFDLHWQLVGVAADSASLGDSGVLSNADKEAGFSFVVYHPTLDEFGIAWTELDAGPGAEIWAARVGTDGSVIQEATLVSDQTGDRPGVSIAPVSFGYALIWDGGPAVGLRTGWLGCVPAS